MDPTVFDRAPIRVDGTIPIFSPPTAFTENYEQIARDHLHALEATGNNPWIDETLWRELEAATIDLIRQYRGTPNSRILDVGVSLGRLLGHFPEMDRYGIDISLGYLAVAQQQGIDVCYGLAEDLPYRDETFDIVVCTDVLEHVIDLNRCAAEMLRVLKQEGILVVRVPYREDLSPYLTEDYPYRFVHLRAFDECSLRLLFERILGQHCVEMRTCGYTVSHSRFRSPLRFRGRDRLVSAFLYAVGAVHSGAARAILERLYRPIDINIVVRKRG